MASTNRLTVSCRTPRLNKRPVRQGELEMPSDQDRVERLALCHRARAVTTPTASTDGSIQPGRSRSSSYSCRAKCSMTSLNA